MATIAPETGSEATHLKAVACSCLIALVIARGDTGKLLSALAALLMCPQALAQQKIHVSFSSCFKFLTLSFYWIYGSTAVKSTIPDQMLDKRTVGQLNN